MVVDGFRFDLASALGRPRGGDFDPRAGLLTAIATDPVLSRRKLVAEPWDATGAGYQVGGFGLAWSEWNDHVQNTVRDFWRGSAGVLELASRISGSSDLYTGAGAGRGPASTSSPPTTGSPCATWSPTRTSTTTPTASRTGTAPARTAR